MALMSMPANVTESAACVSRLPPQVAHGEPTMKRETRFFIRALCVVAKVSSTYFRAPTKVPM